MRLGCSAGRPKHILAKRIYPVDSRDNCSNSAGETSSKTKERRRSHNCTCLSACVQVGSTCPTCNKTLLFVGDNSDSSSRRNNSRSSVYCWRPSGASAVLTHWSYISERKRERDRGCPEGCGRADGRTDWMHEEEETESMGRERRRRNRMTIIRDRVTFPVS